MKLKFSRTVPVGASYYAAGQEVEVKDQHAAEVYIAHGYATAVGAAPSGQTLDRRHLGGVTPSAAPPGSVNALPPGGGVPGTVSVPKPAGK